MMNTLVRNATSNISLRLNGYEPLDCQLDEVSYEESHGRRTLSKQRNLQSHAVMKSSLSYRRARARQRQIFLKSYKLGSTNKLRRSRSSKLKKVVIKVKAVVVSLVSILRLGGLKSCSCRSAISASSPMPVTKCC